MYKKTWYGITYKIGGECVFLAEEIQNLNELQFAVYNYIMKHREKILYLKIRELGDGAHVSTTTILRFCKKMGCGAMLNLRLSLNSF